MNYAYKEKQQRMKCVYILLFILIVGSCQRKNDVDIPISPVDLNTAIYTSYQKIETDYLFSYPESMILDGKHLIVQDRKSTDYLFHSIDLESDSLVSEFGIRGNGPGEYSDITLNPHWNEYRKSISFFDANKRSIYSYKKDNNSFRFISNFSLTNVPNLENEYFRELFDCGDYYLALGKHGIFDENRFAVLDSTYHIINKLGKYPEISDLLIEPQKNLGQILFSSSFFKISPNRNKAVFASYRGALLQFYDLSEMPDSIHNIKSIQLEVPIKKEQISVEHDGWVYGFEDIYVTDNYIYAIYNGQTAEENPLLGKHILVYNWKGELGRIYRLDINLRSLIADESNKCIYAIGYTEDDNFFLTKIEMPDFKAI